MRNEDNDCIRYLMKEMDPSEELLMERAMMEDEDLLIEVESMRQTLTKLDKLPQMDPPSDVTDSIMEQAAEQAEKNRRSHNALAPVFKYAVAATLALTVTAGGMWFYMGADQQQSGSTKTASVAPGNSSRVTSSDLSNASLNNKGTTASTSRESGVEPWIDRNDILHFEDHFGSQDSNFKAIIRNATQKLQLIEQPMHGTSRVKSLQLTGSGN